MSSFLSESDVWCLICYFLILCLFFVLLVFLFLGCQCICGSNLTVKLSICLLGGGIFCLLKCNNLCAGHILIQFFFFVFPTVLLGTLGELIYQIAWKDTTRSCTKHRSRLSSTTSWTLLLWLHLAQRTWQKQRWDSFAPEGIQGDLSLGVGRNRVYHLSWTWAISCQSSQTCAHIRTQGAWAADTARPILLWSVPHVMCPYALCQAETATMIGMFPTANNVNKNCE